MKTRYDEYANTMHAILKAMAALKTWASIQDATDALRHVQLRFHLLDKEMLRHEQDNCSGACAQPAEAGEGEDDGRDHAQAVPEPRV